MFLRIQAIQLSVLVSVLVHAAILFDIGRRYTAMGKPRETAVVTFQAVIVEPSRHKSVSSPPAKVKTESVPPKPSVPRRRPRPVPIAKTRSVPKPKPARRQPSPPPPVSKPTRIAKPAKIPKPVPQATMVTVTAMQQDYTRKILRRIEQHKRYPPAARLRRLTVSVTLSLRVAADGHIESLRCRTGTAVLCRAAKRAVREAAPFPPLPDGIGHLAFEYRMRFRLY